MKGRSFLLGFFLTFTVLNASTVMANDINGDKRIGLEEAVEPQNGWIL